MENENIPEEELLWSDVPEEEIPVKKKRSPVYGILLGAFLLVFLVSAVMVVRYMVGSRKAAQEYDQLASILQSEQDKLDQDVPDNSTGGGQDSSQGQVGTGILPEYQTFYEMNDHLVGWINVPDTVINYPVMQTPEQPNYYLKRNFYRESSDWGAIYAREECNVFTPSDNVVLYGHRMNDGFMFAALHNFSSKAYWQEHQTFTFDTLYEHHTYRVWAVFRTSVIEGQGLAYHTFNDAENMAEFDQFVQDVRELAFYDTGIVPTYGDKLLSLSTCEYSSTQGRFVVCAVRVDAQWELE